MQLLVVVQCDLLRRRSVGKVGYCRCEDAAVLLSLRLVLAYLCDVCASGDSFDNVYDSHSLELETYLMRKACLCLMW